MSSEQNKQFVRQHFEEFVNRENLDIAERNFAPETLSGHSRRALGLSPGAAFNALKLT